MTSTYVSLSVVDLVLASLLLAINFALSFALRLRLGMPLLVASVRMTVQLLVIGRVLKWIFALDRPLVILALAVVMSTLAGVAAAGRTSRRFAGIYWDSLVSVLGSSFVITGFALFGILRVEPWYEPQYLVPLLGMVLGNTLSGISLATDRFMEGISDRRDSIETLLALGGTRWEAALGEVQGAMRTGMIPTLNSMAVMGLVSLPGMTTGQILAGAAPGEAVRYQIVIMFMIASATALGILGMVLLAFRTLFDKRHRLRLDRLAEPKDAASLLRIASRGWTSKLRR
ncbi:ABC transporter permease [Vulgatibacter incomptus]|uniref:YbbM seven transmembrane helix protein n=1 Tax=Vulgatibacter incomptus TaxID=1391653 RepID=A0A0K1P9H5_9BACT|nr:iron export ABC transporter permease subunit FetB [Vulgatibacter incomptus]AKU89739.1 YbbM seven transmembrane helix protein [Vulgatibacter incomptus]